PPGGVLLGRWAVREGGAGAGQGGAPGGDRGADRRPEGGAGDHQWRAGIDGVVERGTPGSEAARAAAAAAAHCRWTPGDLGRRPGDLPRARRTTLLESPARQRARCGGAEGSSGGAGRAAAPDVRAKSCGGRAPAAAVRAAVPRPLPQGGRAAGGGLGALGYLLPLPRV